MLEVWFQYINISIYIQYAEWEIVQFLHHVVLTIIKEVILASIFQSNFVDELTIANNQSWISMHYYVMASWKRVLILLLIL